MDSLHLTDCERELYAELFASLDPENEGKIGVSAAFELITHSELSVDVIEKVIELCGAKRLGHFGRSQFYIALKLIACAQKGLPLNADTLANTNNIPLPVFASCKEGRKCEQRRNAAQNHSKDQQSNNKIINCQRVNSDSCHLPPPPPTKGNRQRHATAKSIEYSLSPVQQPPVSAKGLLKDNCEVGLMNDDSSSNSSHEPINSPKCESTPQRNWNSRKDVPSNWEYCDEEHRLLGNDEDSEQAHSSNDDEESSDIWTITKEQKEYYLKQFKALEIDADGKLCGRTAKEFFEKSKLPQSILSKIWKLSDMDKDGALTCEEFCTAMHLVVLRRNNVEIPDVLPSSSKQLTDQELQNNSRSTPKADIPDSNALSTWRMEKINMDNKQWTKFTDSPTNITVTSPPISSTSSSAGIMQPANFDFNAASIERDPKILHPVALRVSPDGQRVPYVANDVLAATISSDVYPTGGVPGVHSNYCATRKEPPPPPPPRPLRHRGHARSSSLDLNRLGKAQVNADIVNEHQRVNSNISPRLPSTTEYRGAFTIYRKSEPAIAANNWLQVLKLKYPLPALVPTFNETDDPIDLMRTVRSLQQRNFYLESIYCDLIQELANALETNTSLETRIKQLVASK